MDSNIEKIIYIESRLVYTILILIVFVYTLSYLEEVEEKTRLEKILDLNIPSLWKSIIKKR
ncbi:hypothetical protein [Aliarcobacter butzleri]|uniref:hypothetical protein n=1 Tax=Aliarcobacter butzleri TaxID=28197 RepID=UPI0015873C62|nr:hypothetical protein [Aliarcobacter butzleri]NUW29568.1 hypothetical protein [Aliarcobacter butzleri]